LAGRACVPQRLQATSGSTMELYILRHGTAEELSASGKDRDRELTTEGIEETQASGKALRALKVHFDLILASPFARAWKTAEIIAEETGANASVLRRCEALSSGAGVPGILAELKKQKCGSLLLVGHEPELSHLISILLAGSAGLGIQMKKGGLCRLTFTSPEPGHSRLDWFFPPKILTRQH
jgi:phosphohistidine phosphatase